MDQAALHLYWLLIGLVALPLSPFNRMAAVIVVARLVNQLGWWALPNLEPGMQAAVFMVAGAAALLTSRTFEAMMVAVFFIPMATASFCWAAGALDLTTAWWTVLGCGIAQVILLPASADWQRIGATVTAYRRAKTIDRALKWLPC